MAGQNGSVLLPVMPPLKPMLAMAVDVIPPGMRYEPKWDGFRTLVFRDGDELMLGSRSEKPLTRYFPELVEALLEALPDRCVIDGETVLPLGHVLDFEALLQRIHPADSRVQLLAQETPAHFVAFDVLAHGDRALLDMAFRDRREQLDAMVARSDRVHLTPYTDDKEVAAGWFSQFEGAGLDGVMAKPFNLPYVPDKRLMRKIKHRRTAECVVAGYRVHKSGAGVGSLLLGLYDDAGTLQHVGVVGAFTTARRIELMEELSPLVVRPGAEHPWVGGSVVAGARAPGGGQSRWQQGKDTSFVALEPGIVVEVGYDHMEGARFRHTTAFVRFRPDRQPRSCTYGQLERPVSFDLERVLAGQGP